MSIPTGTTPTEIKELESYLLDLPLIHYFTLAATVFYVWDFVLTFPQEVKLLWATKWNVTRSLFFVNRYFALGATIVATFFSLDTSPTKYIGIAYGNYSIVGLVLVGNIEIILLRRLFALFDHQKHVVIPLIMLFVVVFGSMLGMAITESIFSEAHEYVFFGACAGTLPGWFYMFWSPLMIFDFILVALAGYKSVHHYRQVPNKNWSGARLMKTLARDSFVYFLCNFAICLINVLLWKLAPAQYIYLGASWIMVIPPVSANHLLINMDKSRYTADGTVDSRDKESSHTDSTLDV
ncbi:hypothetical protein BV22DRAFT_1030973 [Leucogyrophana mollusca]|uniref:Uncharacterized protein n=1 Tax=Leucogyrophana mollusca TaxID=85980 RepID=A0ACB8BTC8_9AGAM|nr:hypothetical protein BV22DRAFT_1030973 [Leucogyrophana mollusca]